MLDTLVWERGQNLILREKSASQLSAAVILAARIEEFKSCSDKKSEAWRQSVRLWPKELELMTHHT
jgi:hypothetical protein